MPKITSITQAVHNQDRVNVSVDGKYRLSLDIFQVAELGVRVGREYSDKELDELEVESQFGKVYARALEYTMLRPHSSKEIRDYLYRKTVPRTRLSKNVDKNGNKKAITDPGISRELADRVYERLVARNYIDDEAFTRWWVSSRSLRKGTSMKKLRSELHAKGVSGDIIECTLAATDRTDKDELAKIIAKKRSRYKDDQKFMQYLARQGFCYDDIINALQQVDD